ncbi:hypothetical protein CcarbDRAFT_5023 [Clostridium carboxidivorans P7]|uniref:Cyclic lactone autoinducer peptide n=1 Tax=Clostridium carboxidivorans P7 TaxID=536227 RepID=C6Q1V5_9CLOT|nr:cyclic lactone autoinducer peptide [Clostridium carboxidivorans]EET84531.1 hypothetical protein CcarbDRAFT_5023 [Clostridium carboxidivorans P7]EFG89840.1 hypothetical protein CLCAR_0033 [Clostridium carboxidivorans P7]
MKKYKKILTIFASMALAAVKLGASTNCFIFTYQPKFPERFPKRE